MGRFNRAFGGWVFLFLRERIDTMRASDLTRRDFFRTTAGAALLGAWATCGAAEKSAEQVPWLEEVQRPPSRTLEPIQLSPLLRDAAGNRLTTVAAWEKRRAELRSQWQELLGSFGPHRGAAPALRVLEEDVVDNVLRQRVAYEIEPGIETEAYLLRPRELPAKPQPGVVVFHSTVDHSIRQPAGVEGVPEKAFGLKLARRGYVTFSPRNYLWPTNTKIQAEGEAKRFLARKPGVTGMAKMLFDAQVAVDILAAQPGVDTNRLGAVGHSLGAKEVLYLAAFDDRIRCTVSSEGGVGMTFSNWKAPWYLGAAFEKIRALHEHHELLAMAAPRPFLLIGGDSADGDRSWPFIAAALPVYELYTPVPPLGLLNHRLGHAVPPIAEERIDQWLDTYLEVA
jgi:dienelactone hydrolase